MTFFQASSAMTEKLHAIYSPYLKIGQFSMDSVEKFNIFSPVKMEILCSTPLSPYIILWLNDTKMKIRAVWRNSY